MEETGDRGCVGQTVGWRPCLWQTQASPFRCSRTSDEASGPCSLCVIMFPAQREKLGWELKQMG